MRLEVKQRLIRKSRLLVMRWKVINLMALGSDAQKTVGKAKKLRWSRKNGCEN